MMSARTLLFLQQSRRSPGPRIEMRTRQKWVFRLEQATKASNAEQGVPQQMLLYSWQVGFFAASVRASWELGESRPSFRGGDFKIGCRS